VITVNKLPNIRHLSLAWLLVSAVGCIGPFAPCPEVGHPGLPILIMDARTSGAPATQVLVVVTSGTDSDTLTAYAPGSPHAITLLTADERPGTYSVSVSATGYEPWTRTGVVVERSGRCDLIQTKEVVARLQPTN